MLLGHKVDYFLFSAVLCNVFCLMKDLAGFKSLSGLMVRGHL